MAKDRRGAYLNLPLGKVATVAGVIAAVTLILVTCQTPKTGSLSGILVENGNPSLILAPCVASAPASAMLLPRGGTNTDSWRISRQPGGGDFARTVPLFGTATGWKLDAPGPQALKPGVSYQLRVGDPNSTLTSKSLLHDLTFDTAQITSMKSGQVIFAGEDGKTVIVDRDEFADRAC